VRNCIVHAAGSVTQPGQEKVRDAVKRLDGFTLSTDDNVEIERDVCTRLVHEAKAWLGQLVEEPSRSPA
jgi:hypothetical protein